jgi:hypothetical protein
VIYRNAKDEAKTSQLAHLFTAEKVGGCSSIRLFHAQNERDRPYQPSRSRAGKRGLIWAEHFHRTTKREDLNGSSLFVVRVGKPLLTNKSLVNRRVVRMKTTIKVKLVMLLLLLLCTQVPSSSVFASSPLSGSFYYGVNPDIMERVTGIPINGSPRQDAPGVQVSQGRDYLAAIAMVVNFHTFQTNRELKYPLRSNQYSLLDDMNNLMIPSGGPLEIHGDSTAANVSRDYGADPRAQTAAVDYEIGAPLYHQHIYHTSPQDATLDIALTLARYQMPVIALVNHGEHCVVIAGFWANGPLTSPASVIALAIYNPWDMNNRAYLSSSNFAKVPMSDWVSSTRLPNPFHLDVASWFAHSYESKDGLDPEPVIGPYAGQTLWGGNYVAIEPDDFATPSDTVLTDTVSKALPNS